MYSAFAAGRQGALHQSLASNTRGFERTLGASFRRTGTFHHSSLTGNTPRAAPGGLVERTPPGGVDASDPKDISSLAAATLAAASAQGSSGVATRTGAATEGPSAHVPVAVGSGGARAVHFDNTNDFRRSRSATASPAGSSVPLATNKLDQDVVQSLVDEIKMNRGESFFQHKTCMFSHLQAEPHARSAALSSKAANERDEPLERVSEDVEVKGSARLSWLAHPGSTFRQLWALLLILLTAWSALWIPWEIGFLDVDNPDAFTLGLGIFIDVSFACDLVLNIFSWVVLETGEVVRDRGATIPLYLKSWFFIDLCSTVPFDTIVRNPESDGDTNALHSLMYIRIIRVLRLLKLARLLKMKRLTRFMAERMTAVTRAMLRLVKLMLSIAYVTHVLASFWHWLARQEMAGRDITLDVHPQSWVVENDLQDASVTSRYVASVYWAVTTLMSVGYGDISAVSATEMTFSVFAQIAGAAFFGIIIANVSSVVEALNARSVAMTRQLNLVREYMIARKLPRQLQERVSKYIAFYYQQRSLFDEANIMAKLSPALRHEITEVAYAGIIRQLDIFQGAEAGFFARLVGFLKPMMFVPGELVAREGEMGREMFFLIRGAVEHVCVEPRTHPGNFEYYDAGIREFEGVDAVSGEFSLVDQREETNVTLRAGVAMKRLRTRRPTVTDDGLEAARMLRATLEAADSESVRSLSGESDDSEAELTQVGHGGQYVEVPVPGAEATASRPRPNGRGAAAAWFKPLTRETSRGAGTLGPAAGETKGVPPGRLADRGLSRTSADKSARRRTTRSSPVASTKHQQSPQGPMSVVTPVYHRGRGIRSAVPPDFLPVHLLGVTTDGRHFGDLSTLSSRRRPCGIRASTVIEVQALSKAHLVLTLHGFPVLKHRIVDSCRARGKRLIRAKYELYKQGKARRRAKRRASGTPAHLSQSAWHSAKIRQIEELQRSGSTGKQLPNEATFGATVLLNDRTVPSKMLPPGLLSDGDMQRHRMSRQLRVYKEHDSGHSLTEYAAIVCRSEAPDVSTCAHEMVEDERDIALRGILHNDHTFKVVWDFAIMLLVVVTMIQVPLSIGFAKVAEDVTLPLERVVDVAFFIDILVNFRTAYIDPQTGVLVVDPRFIARTYLRGAFALDFISTFPFDLVGRALVGDGGGVAKVDKILRLFRMLKLARLVKLSRLIFRQQNKLMVSPATLQLVVLLLQVSLIAHVCGCFWMFSASLNHGVDEDDPTASGDGLSWWTTLLSKGAVQDVLQHQYAASMYWAFTTMTTVGYGDLVPTTDSERGVAILFMLIGATIFGYIVGSVSTLVARLNANAALHAEAMEGVSEYVADRRLPRGLARRVEEYFEHYLQTKSAFPEDEILSVLPEQMRTEVLVEANRSVLESEAFFGRVDEDFMAHAISLLMPQLYTAGTYVFHENESPWQMYFITSGAVDVVHQPRDAPEITYTTLRHGAYFGELALLLGTRRSASARARTRCTLMALEKDDLHMLVSLYPSFADHITHTITTYCFGKASHPPSSSTGTPAVGIPVSRGTEESATPAIMAKTLAQTPPEVGTTSPSPIVGLSGPGPEPGESRSGGSGDEPAPPSATGETKDTAEQAEGGADLGVTSAGDGATLVADAGAAQAAAHDATLVVPDVGRPKGRKRLPPLEGPVPLPIDSNDSGASRPVERGPPDRAVRVVAKVADGARDDTGAE